MPFYVEIASLTVYKPLITYTQVLGNLMGLEKIPTFTNKQQLQAINHSPESYFVPGNGNIPDTEQATLQEQKQNHSSAVKEKKITTNP